MSSDEPPVPPVPSAPKKRATVAQVDRKLDELTEQLDIMCSDIKDIKAKMWAGGRAKRLSSESVEAVTVNVKTKKPERKKKPTEKKEK